MFHRQAATLRWNSSHPMRALLKFTSDRMPVSASNVMP